jgi:hypothetical protein
VVGQRVGISDRAGVCFSDSREHLESSWRLNEGYSLGLLALDLGRGWGTAAPGSHPWSFLHFLACRLLP